MYKVPRVVSERQRGTARKVSNIYYSSPYSFRFAFGEEELHGWCATFTILDHYSNSCSAPGVILGDIFHHISVLLSIAFENC
jgi:hypothetical protein